MNLLPLFQDAQTVLTPAVFVIIVLLGLAARELLLSHQTQVDKATDSIKNAQVRTYAEDVVRWLETDPTHVSKTGFEQRSTGIAKLAFLCGIPIDVSTVAIDAAYNAMKLANQIEGVWPKSPVAPSAPPVTTPADAPHIILPQ